MNRMQCALVGPEEVPFALQLGRRAVDTICSHAAVVWPGNALKKWRA